MRPEVDSLKKLALDLIFPRWCVGCGRGGEFLCPDCIRTLTPARLTLYTTHAGAGQYLSSVSAPYAFRGVMREAVHQLKYRNLRALAEVLGRFLGDYDAAHPRPVDIITAVPLHPRRLRERGYNQSALLAEELGKLTGREVRNDILERRRDTGPQALTASAAARRVNVRGAFRCRNGAGLKGKKLLLIDDVVTSGATMNDCARALGKAGAATVRGLALAMDID